MARGRKGSGVQLRANDIRIRFTWNGTRYEIPLAWKPSTSNAKAAQKLAADVKDAIRLGVFTFEKFFPDSEHAKKPEPVDQSFATYARLWQESRGNLSEAVRDKDRLAVEFWKKIIGELTNAGLDAVVPSELKAKIGKLPGGNKHQNNLMAPLRGIFDLWVADDPRSRVSPMLGVKNGKVQKSKPDPFDLDEVELIIADMAEHYDPRVAAYYEFAFFSGLRPEEQIALEWPKIDGRKRVGRVDVAKHRGVLKGTKNYEVRDVEFNDRAWAALERMRSWTALKRDDDGRSFIFENPRTNAPWASEADQRDLYWTPTLQRLRLRHRFAYQTRSTCATMMLMADMNPKYCADQLGHSVVVFMTKYATWINGKANDAERAKFNKALARGAAPREAAA
jgi:integrase